MIKKKPFLQGIIFLLLINIPTLAKAQEKMNWNSYLPEGEGKELIESLCIQCHGLKETVMSRKNLKGWQDAIYDMVSRGAMLLPEEIDIISKYLADSFGPDHPIPAAIR